MGADAFAAICMFDMGSAITTFGPNYAVACALMGARDGKKIGLRDIVKSMLTTPTFDTYLFVVLLNVMHWQLPKLAADTVAMAAGANTFLAMLTIGILFDLKFEKGGAGLIARVLGVRYAVCGAVAVLLWFFFPAPARDGAHAVASPPWPPSPTAPPSSPSSRGATAPCPGGHQFAQHGHQRGRDADTVVVFCPCLSAEDGGALHGNDPEKKGGIFHEKNAWVS